MLNFDLESHKKQDGQNKCSTVVLQVYGWEGYLEHYVCSEHLHGVNKAKEGWGGAGGGSAFNKPQVGEKLTTHQANMSCQVQSGLEQNVQFCQTWNYL